MWVVSQIYKLNVGLMPSQLDMPFDVFIYELCFSGKGIRCPVILYCAS